MKNMVTIFGIDIYFYSICILLGVILAYIVITRQAKKENIKEDLVLNTIFYGLLVGIIGARLYYVIFNFDYYKDNPCDIFKLWNGGLAIHGGIILGAIFVYFYSKKYKISFIKLTDIIMPGVILAQAIGRWGNFFNQEAYGIAVGKELLEKLLVPKFIINGMYIGGSYYLPTFYFESIWCIIGFILILIIRKKHNRLGLITSFYMIWYSMGRLIIESFRTDSLMFFKLKQAQIISIVGIILGIVLLIKTRKKGVG